nr:class I SAM-dependent methyltransferase [Streptacidiphilus neutrinimicus]
MSADDWLGDTRASYDTMAPAYGDVFRDLLDRTPYERALLTLFADQVREAGGGPVADVGCGAGRITGFLAGLGIDVFGIDLSPVMIEVARRDHPELRFEVGSMTELDLAESSVAGVLAWYSLIHIPDDEIGPVLARFHRALRPGGSLLLGFHVGDESVLRTQWRDGVPIRVHVHRRRPEQMAVRLQQAGFTVESTTTLTSGESPLGAILFARRAVDART